MALAFVQPFFFSRISLKDSKPAAVYTLAIVLQTERTTWIAQQARAIGFDLCGVASVSADSADDASTTSANNVWPELARIPEWLARGHAGEMRWLSDPRRESPQQVMQGARSVIVCAVNYNSAHPYSTQFSAAESRDDSPRGWISRYAWGTDYHETIGAKLEALVNAMRAQFPEPFDAKWYVDTGPIHERIAAQRAGFGTVGKHTLLIHPELGSWIFLCVILTTLDLAPSSELSAHQHQHFRRQMFAGNAHFALTLVRQARLLNLMFLMRVCVFRI